MAVKRVVGWLGLYWRRRGSDTPTYDSVETREWYNCRQWCVAELSDRLDDPAARPTSSWKMSWNFTIFLSWKKKFAVPRPAFLPGERIQKFVLIFAWKCWFVVETICVYVVMTASDECPAVWVLPAFICYPLSHLLIIQSCSWKERSRIRQ